MLSYLITGRKYAKCGKDHLKILQLTFLTPNHILMGL